MTKRTEPSILQNFDTEIAEMLENDEMKLWYFSPLAVFDMWENEEATGDPGNSLYLRGDEIE